MLAVSYIDFLSSSILMELINSRFLLPRVSGSGSVFGKRFATDPNPCFKKTRILYKCTGEIDEVGSGVGFFPGSNPDQSFYRGSDPDFLDDRIRDTTTGS